MTTPERVIYHIDCNAFFASVEELLYPELKGSPMAVCGNPAARRATMFTANIASA